MAVTAAGAALTEQHRLRQVRVAATAARQLLALWPIWTGDEGSFAAFAAAVTALVEARHRDSATLAGAYYQAFRLAEVGEVEPVQLAAPPEPQRVRVSLEVTARASVRRALIAGVGAEAARRIALTRTTGAVQRHVLNGGRETVVASVAADPRTGQWRRVTAASPCHWCAMIASRGPVFTADTVRFRSHDACRCTAEPAYPGTRMDDRAAGFRALWDDATEGLSGPEAVNAFRRALSN